MCLLTHDSFFPESSSQGFPLSSSLLILILKYNFYFVLVFLLVPMGMKVLPIWIWIRTLLCLVFCYMLYPLTVCNGHLTLWTQTGLPHNFSVLNTFTFVPKVMTYMQLGTHIHTHTHSIKTISKVIAVNFSCLSFYWGIIFLMQSTQILSL